MFIALIIVILIFLLSNTTIKKRLKHSIVDYINNYNRSTISKVITFDEYYYVKVELDGNIHDIYLPYSGSIRRYFGETIDEKHYELNLLPGMRPLTLMGDFVKILQENPSTGGLNQIFI